MNTRRVRLEKFLAILAFVGEWVSPVVVPGVFAYVGMHEINLACSPQSYFHPVPPWVLTWMLENASKLIVGGALIGMAVGMVLPGPTLSDKILDFFCTAVGDTTARFLYRKRWLPKQVLDRLDSRINYKL